MARVFPAKCYFEYFTFEEKSVATHMNFEKPAFNIHDICDLLENKDYSQVYSSLENDEINATLEYYDWDHYYPAIVISKEGFYKLISISPLPEAKKKAIRNWLDHEVIPAVKQNWQKNLKPLWKESMSWTGAREWDYADDDSPSEVNSNESPKDQESLEALTQ